MNASPNSGSPPNASPERSGYSSLLSSEGSSQSPSPGELTPQRKQSSSQKNVNAVLTQVATKLSKEVPLPQSLQLKDSYDKPQIIYYDFYPHFSILDEVRPFFSIITFTQQDMIRYTHAQPSDMYKSLFIQHLVSLEDENTIFDYAYDLIKQGIMNIIQKYILSHLFCQTIIWHYLESRDDIVMINNENFETICLDMFFDELSNQVEVHKPSNGQSGEENLTS